MGLDQYAYAAASEDQYREYWDRGQYDPDAGFVSPVTKPKELAYWRKHPNLQGWMEQLWQQRALPPTDSQDCVFNGVQLELFWDDLDRLEQDIRSGAMSKLRTVGFFFGEASDDHYRDQDLNFIKAARSELFLGLRVFYNSSW